MNHTRSRRLLAALPFALAAGVLAGCTAAPGGANDAANDAAAVKFVACLTDEGQTAKIIDGGQVGLLLPDDDSKTGSMSLSTEAGDEGAPQVTAMIVVDDEGTWLAASAPEGYSEDGGMRDAWSTCETKVPEFEQPEPDMSGTDVHAITPDEVVESSLAFAECARGEGYADFADPDEYGMLDFPSGMTEDEFRSLLEACVDPEGFGVPVSPASAESFDFDWIAVMSEFGGMGGVIAVPAEPVN